MSNFGISVRGADPEQWRGELFAGAEVPGAAAPLGGAPTTATEGFQEQAAGRIAPAIQSTTPGLMNRGREPMDPAQMLASRDLMGTGRAYEDPLMPGDLRMPEYQQGLGMLDPLQIYG